MEEMKVSRRFRDFKSLGYDNWRLCHASNYFALGLLLQHKFTEGIIKTTQEPLSIYFIKYTTTVTLNILKHF